MCDLIVSVPGHCLSFYLGLGKSTFLCFIIVIKLMFVSSLWCID